MKERSNGLGLGGEGPSFGVKEATELGEGWEVFGDRVERRIGGQGTVFR